MDKFANKSINSLEFIEKLNEGSFGIVFKGYFKDGDSKTIVAIKKIKKKNPDEIIEPTTLREVFILKNLIHPNLIRLLDIIIDNNEIYLIYEYMDMDLYNFIYRSKNFIPKTVIKEILYNILKGLAFLHENFVIHRDLKLKNILISKDGKIVKIADLGLSRKLSILNPNYSKRIGTLHYMAPEILLNFTDYSFTVDIWAIGCIFYEIVFKKKLFHGNTFEEQLQEIAKVIGIPTNENWANIESNKDYKRIYPNFIKGIFNEKVKGLSYKAVDLLKQMLIYNPNKRIDTKKALEHVSLF